MKNRVEKPTPEAKALSLFLMAFKKTSQIHKEKSIRINRLWNQVLNEDLDISDYIVEVQNMLTSFGGYSVVVEKTVRFYIEKTGEWTLKGDDKYCIDAKEFADNILKK